jgi:hypothetical protein
VQWLKSEDGLEIGRPNNMATSEPSKAAPKLALLCSVYAKSYSIGSRAKSRAAAKSRIFPEIINNPSPNAMANNVLLSTLVHPKHA